MRWRFALLGGPLLLLGFLCLNFTTTSGVEHHREWARSHGFPEPSDSIYWAGVALTVLGAGIVGFGFSSKKRMPES